MKEERRKQRLSSNSASTDDLDPPYGKCGWSSLLVLTFLALLCFYLASFTCWLTVSETNGLDVYVGYWRRELDETAAAVAREGKSRHYCNASWDQYTKDTVFDGLWRFGKAVTIIGPTLSFFVFLFGILIIFVKGSKGVFSFIGCSSIVLAILSILLLSGLGSDVCDFEECRMGLGGYMAIAASLLFLGTAIVAYRLKSLVRAYDDSLEEKEKYYNEERRAQRQSTQRNKSRPSQKTNNKNSGVDDQLYYDTNPESPVKTKKSSGTKKKKKNDVEEQIMEES
jgi:hypothetical protein